MYDPLLDSFFAAVEAGSFTKAAELLYISATAVMKQMNALESRLGLKLLERGRDGVRLSPEGRIIYESGKFIADHSRKALAEARRLSQARDSTFRVGSSFLNPAWPFMELWYKLSRSFPGHRLHLVPFEDDHRGILQIIDRLGESFDFLIGVCDSREWLSRCNFLPLGRYRKMIAVSREHPLAGRSRLCLEEFHGQGLMMVPRGDSGVNDFLRNDLERNHPEIRLLDTQPFYDLSVFNRCAESGDMLLTIECWQDVHPGLVTIPVDWDYSIPYGLLYGLEPTAEVLSFVELARGLIGK